jgi:hypothetical protein
MCTIEERAMFALEAMAETWAERRAIAQSIESIPASPEVRALILRHVKLAYAEGLYDGHTSLTVPSEEA